MTILRRLRDESGVALVFALGTMTVLAITTISVISYTSSNDRHSNRSVRGQQAVALAEAGVNVAAATLAESDAPLSSSALARESSTGACPDGVNTCNLDPYQTGDSLWFGSLDAAHPDGPRWTITSWGVVPSATPGAPDVVRRLVAEIEMVTTSVHEPNAASWNFVYSTRTSDDTTCDVDVTGTNVVIDVPLYVAGNLCFTGTNAKIIENTATGGQPVSLTVVGKLAYIGENSKVGESSAEPITRGAVGVGCATSITGVAQPCSNYAATRYFVGENGTAQATSAPQADFDSWYSNAAPGPEHDCQSSTSPPSLSPSVFDNNSVRDNSAGTFNLTPSSSYRCRAYDEGGNLVGELSWDWPSKTFTLAGTIFIDGSANVTYNGTVNYNGSASLYLSGSLTLSGTNGRLCATSSGTTCDFASWDPNSEMLMVIADGSPSAINFSGTNNKFQGALWANSTANVNFEGTNVEFEGPIVAGGYTWATRVTLKPLPVITQLPPGAPLTPNVHVEPDPPRYVGN